MRGEFKCYECDGPSIVLPDDLIENAVIRCAGCGATHGTLREFRRIVGSNGSVSSPSTAISGC